MQLSPLYEQAEALLLLAEERGVGGCLVPSYGPEEWSRQDRLNRLEGVVQALGIHPWCIPGRNPDELVHRLDDAFQTYPARWGDKLRAVGEFGLDRSREEYKDCFEVQKMLFARHLEWAERLSLPVIIHVVKAHGACCELLSRGPRPASGVLHSFSGPKELLQQYAEFDLCYSYSGNLARSEKAREALRHTPQDRLMFETDGPEGPQIEEEEVLSPASLGHVVRMAAKILDKSTDWCWATHRENCARVFGL